MADGSHLAQPLTSTEADDGRQIDIMLLSLCWAFLLSSSTAFTTAAALTAKYMGASSFTSSFCVALFLMGTALISLPSAYLFTRFGRRNVFIGGASLGICAGVLAMFACMVDNETGVALLLWASFCL
jgi:MFS family permease